jgi:hypothetical protein
LPPIIISTILGEGNTLAKKKRMIYQEGTAPAIQTDWAILNKDTGECVGVYNPEGSTTRLRKAAIQRARELDLSFTRTSIIPVGMMKPEKIESAKVWEAKRLEHPPK